MFKMKRKTKRFFSVIAVILIAVSLSALLGNMTGGFQDSISEWSPYEVNEENLYQQLDFADDKGVLANGADGITAKLGDDNVIRVSGTAEKDIKIVIGTYTLKQGVSYVLDSSYNEGSRGGMYMCFEKSNGEEYAACYTDEYIISGSSLDSDMTVTLVLKIADGTKVNEKLKPVLCEGIDADDLVKFYK